jgi:DegV family protein with EDD domain
MNSLCIVTDPTALFTNSNFLGREHVFTLPLSFQLEGKVYTKENFPLSNLPCSADAQSSPKLIMPSMSEIRSFFVALSEKYNEIICIFLSNALFPYCSQVEQIASGIYSNPKIQIINSQTTSIGLGLLVQSAAEMVSQGCSSFEIERQIRNQIQHTYTIFCTPAMTYLFQNGLVDYAQAQIGEMYGLYPIFGIEDGHLHPIDKMRNYRQALTFFQDYLDEFEQLKHIAWLHGSPENSQDFKMFRDHIADNFDEEAFMEKNIHAPLATLLGPNVFGLIIVEE